MANHLCRCLLIGLVALLAMPRNARADSDTLREIGDVLQYALPGAGGVTAVVIQDWEGFAQWGASLGTQMATVGGIKLVVDKTRPNRGKQSFPSGHTAAAFQGAAFLQRRYGWEFGVPAYALAALTGYSRVDATKHDFWDVTFGAAIGIGSVYIFTTPYEIGDTAFKVTPVLGENVYGLQITLGEGVHRTIDNLPPPKPKPVNEDRLRNVQVITGTDPTVITNRVEFTGSLLDFSGNPEPSASRITGTRSAARVDWAITPEHMIGMDIAMVTNSLAPTASGSSAGFGDMIVRYLNRFDENIDAEWWQPKAMAWGFDTLIPTGNFSDGTGVGWWIVRPKFQASFTPLNNFNFFPGVSYYWSAWSDTGAGIVSDIGLSLMVEYRFDNGVYFNWDPEILFPLGGGGSKEVVADHSFEIGWQINRDWGIFVNYALSARNVLNPNFDPGFRDRFYDDIYTFGVRWFY